MLKEYAKQAGYWVRYGVSPFCSPISGTFLVSLILGLNAFHPDSAACVLKDGRLVAAVAEERLGARVKHVAGFPGRAIAAVLKMAGATIRDVDCVAIGNDSKPTWAPRLDMSCARFGRSAGL